MTEAAQPTRERASDSWSFNGETVCVRYDERDPGRAQAWREAMTAEGRSVIEVDWRQMVSFAIGDGYMGHLRRQGIDPVSVMEVRFIDGALAFDGLAMMLGVKEKGGV